MKRLIRKLLIYTICLSGMTGISSCKDYLDKAPESEISSEMPFKNFRNFQGFVEELYSSIPMFSGHGFHTCFNLGEEVYWALSHNYLSHQFDQGNYWVWATDGSGWFRTGGNPSSQVRADKACLWGLSWYAIRKANIGIANLKLLTEATEEERRLIEGQLYFFRGWYHFMLMQYWGGLPYIDSVLPSDGSPIELSRLSYQETADKAAQDFQHAADLLPINWDETTVGKETAGNNGNNLRINKIMALAYLGKNLLWAGSPLMNSVSTGSSTYNKDYCKKAADAFAKALKLTEETNRYELANFEQWTELFYTHNQNGLLPGLKEAIFMENLAESSSRWRWNMVNDFRPTCINASGVKVNPTANYVDYYGMKNGYPIKDITKKDLISGYDPEYPWKDRDPRFYKDIIFDGVQCTTNSKGDQDEYTQYASLFTGGYYRTCNEITGVLTGYMNMKFCPQFSNDFDQSYRENNVLVLCYMRLADVYLMYAEATANGYGTPQSRADGYHLTAVDAVNKIRERAGVENVKDEYLGSIESFMSELRRERAVELAFEGHRFVDLRRWMLLLEKPYTQKKAVYFDRAITESGQFDYKNPQNARVLNIREEVLLERNYGQKHYWFPFQQKDVNMYPGFYQNPGW